MSVDSPSLNKGRLWTKANKRTLFISAFSRSLQHICSLPKLLTPWHWLPTPHGARHTSNEKQQKHKEEEERKEAQRAQEVARSRACSHSSPASVQINFSFQFEAYMISDIQATAH